LTPYMGLIINDTPNSDIFPGNTSEMYLFIIFLKVRLYALTLYQATDCAAVTDISGVTVCCQLSR